MKILFYDAKQYDIESFNKQLKDYPEITVDYIETDINENTTFKDLVIPDLLNHA